MAGKLELKINGRKHAVEATPARTLLTCLRDELEITGAKYGCGEGQCGACTVLVEGNPVRSCTLGVNAAAGKQIRTVEGLASGAQLTPLQQAFLDHGAFQCGFCTSGMLMSATALLERTPHPSDEEILRAMQGNVCRCGMFLRILAAIRTAAAQTASGRTKA